MRSRNVGFYASGLKPLTNHYHFLDSGIPDIVPKLTEINPRFGGGSIFTTIAGINFVDVILAEKFGDKLELEEPRDITITRYWDEMEL